MEKDRKVQVRMMDMAAEKEKARTSLRARRKAGRKANARYRQAYPERRDVAPSGAGPAGRYVSTLKKAEYAQGMVTPQRSAGKSVSGARTRA
jgi:hypothetical protein